MSQIYWDTMLFVYWFEDHPDYAKRVQRIYSRMEERRDTLCTSVFTLGEILTGLYQKGAFDLASRIRDLFRPPHIIVLPFSLATVESYAEIRAQHRVPPADSIHLATASAAKVDLFLTNDRRLLSLVVPGINFIAGMDVNLF